jgi:hypothetical protein
MKLDKLSGTGKIDVYVEGEGWWWHLLLQKRIQ